MPRPLDGSSRYLAGLDGLRAVAVFAVIAYHLNLGFAPGGLLGVGVFFVLSGYLITHLLVGEWERRGRIDFRRFWLRRARRLLPALFLMLATVLAYVTLFDARALTALRGDTLAAVLYFSNWWYVFHHVSYFARFGPPSPLTHLWSLAVEEQFYLIWPVALALGLALARRRYLLVFGTVLLSLASALLMAVLYHPGMDPSRVYYGTDTRAFGLLLGAALALMGIDGKGPASRTRWVREILGFLGLAAILLMIWRTNEYQTFLYRGGMLLLSLATVAVVAALVHQQSLVGRLLGVQPLRWLGVRSYAIYLWHYPVIILTSPRVDTGSPSPVRALLQVLLSIGLAALSWHFLEEPIRQGALRRLWARGWAALQGHGAWRIYVASVGSLGLLGLSAIGLSGLAKAAPQATAPMKIGLSPTTHLQSTPQATEPPRGRVIPSSPAPPVTAIGDSVMVDAAPYLEKLVPGIVVNAHIGRQLTDTEPVIAALKARHQLGKTVIVELGTNGPFTKKELLSLLRSLGPHHAIVLVNTRVPRPWQNVVNSTISAVAASYPHAVLVNWFQASSNKNGWFYPDGVHLNPTGAHAYAKLLAKAAGVLTNKPE